MLVMYNKRDEREI